MALTASLKSSSGLGFISNLSPEAKEETLRLEEDIVLHLISAKKLCKTRTAWSEDRTALLISGVWEDRAYTFKVTVEKVLFNKHYALQCFFNDTNTSCKPVQVTSSTTYAVLDYVWMNKAETFL